ncbi:ras gtpase-related [Anaeramoeba flamelloides]|uniref:Ras gtpase-related n=1 Tax=Anaeramoeba flamelloides TaxID=1746091 RepID=A0ABQ8XPC1_9EUKA|nr:ras gtpase-related [Anaeramoeba flamelloides]
MDNISKYPTIEDVYDKKVVIDEETFWIEIFDTVAEDDYYDPRHPHLREVEGFLIVYAINSRKSFSKVSSFRKQIQITKNAVKVPMIIVGNKNDLENERQVSQCEGKDLATSFDYPFIETSAKTRSNVEEAFCDLVREIRMFKFETQQDNNTAIKKKNKGCLVM